METEEERQRGEERRNRDRKRGETEIRDGV
jgi:hypothetical protein